MDPSRTRSPASDSPAPCRRCGAALTGPYCSTCGQHVAQPLSIPRFARGAVARLLELDLAFPRTVWGLLRRPGWVIREYLEGNRATWFNPAKFLFVNATLYALIVTWRVPAEDIFPGVTDERSRQAVLFAIGAIAYSAFAYLLVAALAARALFRRAFASVAEAYVALLYVYAQALLVLAVIALVYWNVLLVRLLLLFYLALVLAQLAGPPRWTAILRALVVYLVYTVSALGTVALVIVAQSRLLG